MHEPDETPDQTAARNERTKLLATTLNTIGLAFSVTGTIVPLITFINEGKLPNSPLLPLAGVWFVFIALTSHMAARHVLGGMKG